MSLVLSTFVHLRIVVPVYFRQVVHYLTAHRPIIVVQQKHACSNQTRKTAMFAFQGEIADGTSYASQFWCRAKYIQSKRGSSISSYVLKVRNTDYYRPRRQIRKQQQSR